MIRTLTLTALVALSTSAMAAGIGGPKNTRIVPCTDNSVPCCDKMPCTDIKKPCSDNGLPNPSTRTLTDCHNVYLFGDVLYWQLKENGTVWAYTQTSPKTDVFKTSESKVTFDFDWGFRVGIGYNMGYDQWDSKVCYTWFQTDETDSVSVNNNPRAIAPSGIFPFTGAGGIVFTFLTLDGYDIGGSTVQFASGTIDWDFKYNMFDWDLGRDYHISKNLTMRPNIGLKGGWINQDVDMTFVYLAALATNGPGPMTVKAENDFWGIGPSGGVDTKWVIGNWCSQVFSIFGDFQAALLWSHFDLSYVVTSTGIGTYNAFSDLDTNQIVPTLRTIIGLGWDSNFRCNRYHVGARLGYDLQYWWNQNYVTSVFTQSRVAQDLALHGATLDLRFDF